MSRKLDPSSKGESEQVSVRLPRRLLVALDLHVERLRRERPGANVGRGDVVRELLHGVLLPSPIGASPEVLVAVGTPPERKGSVEATREPETTGGLQRVLHGAVRAGLTLSRIARATGTKKSWLESIANGSVTATEAESRNVDDWVARHVRGARKESGPRT